MPVRCSYKRGHKEKFRKEQTLLYSQVLETRHSRPRTGSHVQSHGKDTRMVSRQKTTVRGSLATAFIGVFPRKARQGRINSLGWVRAIMADFGLTSLVAWHLALE